jgi:hypothetical protein
MSIVPTSGISIEVLALASMLLMLNSPRLTRYGGSTPLQFLPHRPQYESGGGGRAEDMVGDREGGEGAVNQ